VGTSTQIAIFNNRAACHGFFYFIS